MSMPCPDYPTDCRAPGSIQRLLVASERSQFTAKAASFGDVARRCSYCGVVYVRSPSPTRLGWLDSRMGTGFHAAPGYA
jgi:hypothetical protein